MGDEKHPLVKFSETETQWTTTVPSQPDLSYGVADQHESDLVNFFSRPTRIFVLGWAIGEKLSININPWELFLKNARIGNRIANFNFLRGTLKIKLVINGNPFYYGRTLVAYKPMSGYDTITDTDFAASDEADLTFWSQHPHLFLDPTTSQAGEMHLPFLYPENGLSITEDLAEWRSFGMLVFRGLTSLAHSNGGIEGVSINVFAWMDDMVLTAPTDTNPALLDPQSGEYEPKGLISRPANAVAAAANALSEAPYIAPYAKATALAASGVAAAAQVFGYCKPVSQESVIYVKPTFFGALTSYNDIDSAVPLSGDRKQELTVDTRTMGLAGIDELDMKHVCSHESYVGQLPWSTNESTNALLGVVGITPSHRMVAGDGGYTFSSTAFAALPFEYWRGSMRIRFQVVCSNYHRGRLMIGWDPDSSLNTETNIRYTRIVDISEERDFTMDVGWGSRHAWLRTDNVAVDPIPFVLGNYNQYNHNTNNGMLIVRVLNSLTEPSAGVDDVMINVFVSGGDDLEFAVPNLSRNVDYLSPFVGDAQFVPQSGEDTEDDLGNVPESVVQETILPEVPIGTASDVFFADPVVSFRQLLKRYVLHDIHGMTSIHSYNILKLPFRPFTPGADPYGLTEIATEPPTPYNRVHHTYFTYVALAYVAFRGSMRWKVHVAKSESGEAPTLFRVENVADSSALPKYDSYSFSHNSEDVVRKLSSGSAGCLATDAKHNAVLEFSVPYYSHLRFLSTKNPSVLDESVDSGHANYQERSHLITLWCANTNISNAAVTRFHACGDDATFGFYCGLPRMYTINTDNPT
jgi:hypothetical protein